jgi:hypothetical protein
VISLFPSSLLSLSLSPRQRAWPPGRPPPLAPLPVGAAPCPPRPLRPAPGAAPPRRCATPWPATAPRTRSLPRRGPLPVRLSRPAWPYPGGAPGAAPSSCDCHVPRGPRWGHSAAPSARIMSPSTQSRSRARSPSAHDI